MKETPRSSNLVFFFGSGRPVVPKEGDQGRARSFQGMKMVAAAGCAVWSSRFQPSATSYVIIDKEGGGRGIESTYVCVRDCVGGERERQQVRERGGREGESVVERMLTGNVWQTEEPKKRPAGARLMGSSK